MEYLKINVYHIKDDIEHVNDSREDQKGTDMTAYQVPTYAGNYGEIFQDRRMDLLYINKDSRVEGLGDTDRDLADIINIYEIKVDNDNRIKGNHYLIKI